MKKSSKKTPPHDRDLAQVCLDIARVIVVAIDAQEKVTLISRFGCELLGFAQDEIVGRNWFDIFVPVQVREQTRSAFHRLIAGDLANVEHYENPVLARNGQERIIAWRNALLKDGARKIVGAIGAGQDITERKKAEAKLQESEERFRRL